MGSGVDQTSQMGFDSELRFLALLCCGALNQSEIIKCLTMIENLRSLLNVLPTLISSLPNVSFYRDLQPTAIATLFVSQHDRLFASFFARMCIDPVTS